ncbi:DUF3025 domain-containing protein [Oceanisphaera sp. KMM 10153]|uniref:DUF3025 domain-containing protein n=1 Tax=Oceanisphaera submarina TaxID=3390193 RepID=UPI00397711E1
MDWDPHVTGRNGVLAQLADLIDTSTPQWPTLAELNRQLAADLPVHFIDDGRFAELNCYYEQAVAQGMVPTRAANWHDFFGAVIWALFPRTKALLNRLHMEDIAANGFGKRTPRRDRVTHFDECGLVLAVSDKAEAEHWLREHDWQRLFISERDRWGNNWQSFIFGHALYEQALAPFIGMTGKCVVLEMDTVFFSLPAAARYPLLDARLAEHLEQDTLFDRPRPLLPLPLLGIPGWWPANEEPAFYQNRDYFRPRRNR